jgi:hypothetical protein
MDNSNTISQLQVLDTINKVASDSAMAQCSDTAAILQTQDGTNLANMANNERLGLNIKDNVYRSQIANRDAVERNADQLIDSVNQNGTYIAAAVERTGGENVRTTLVSNNELSNLIQQNTNDIESTQQSIALENRKQLQDQHYAVINSGKDVMLNENNNATNIELQASTSVFKTKEALAKVESTLELQAVNNNAQVQYEAVKLNAEAAAEMADCCCELKEEVTKSNFETQKVARDIEMQRLRDQLSVATTESLVSKIQSRHHRYNPCYPPPCPPRPPPCPCPYPYPCPPTPPLQ